MRLLQSLNNKTRFLFSTLIVGSFFMLMLVPAAEPAGAGSCPGGWEDCNHVGLVCCTIFGWLEEELSCTEWEPDPNYSYPDCRYRVKRYFTRFTCFWLAEC